MKLFPEDDGRFAEKRIVLGVSGGIAAYKAVELCRRLMQLGAYVSPVMTEGALRFVGEATFSALASERAHTSLWDDDRAIPHTFLGQHADAIVVAPATARVIGCYAAGIANDLLTTTLLATKAPVVICPAMHTEMWGHPAVQDNINTLRRRGVTIVEPGMGPLAGGDAGEGRLASTDFIMAAIENVIRPQDLEGHVVLITAGGTREPLDPVRYIGNRSSGKQGHALAAEAAARGAKVMLITTADLFVGPEIDVIRLSTAAEMERAVMEHAPKASIIVMAAAVADFTPVSPSESKLKRSDGIPVIELAPTTDVIRDVASQRVPNQILVSFAAETSNLLDNARQKLIEKGVDFIAANDVTAAGVGMDHDTNSVTVLDSHGHSHYIPLTTKRSVARQIFDVIISDSFGR